jgi:hypothetical protein
MEKRKGIAAEGSTVKRPRTAFLRTPSLGVSGLKASGDAIAAIPVSFASPANTSGENPPSSSDHVKESSKVDCEKGPSTEARSTVVHFAVPPNFMADDIVDRSKMFPHIENYLLPSQQVRFANSSVEDIDASVVGLSFMVGPKIWPSVVPFYLYSVLKKIFCRLFNLLWLSTPRWRRSNICLPSRLDGKRWPLREKGLPVRR